MGKHRIKYYPDKPYYQHRPDEENPCGKCKGIWFHRKSGECIKCRAERLQIQREKRNGFPTASPPPIKADAQKEKKAMKDCHYD